MNTAIMPVPSAVAPVVTAPVVTFAKATEQQVNLFCERIRLGAPTTDILPASITDLKKSGGISDAQLAQIKAARKAHGSLCVEQRTLLFKLAKSREVRGARFNKNAQLVSMRFGDKPKAAKIITTQDFPLAKV